MRLLKNNLEKLSRAKNAHKLMPELHEKAFEKVDCLQCANCCKTISPRFNKTDMPRIAKYLRITEGELIENYLRYDEDGDFVMRRMPCAFLDDNNYCSIYDVRPRDCQNYPYTDSDVFYKQKNVTVKNCTTCPAVVVALGAIDEVAK